VKGFKQDVPVRVMQRASTIEPHYVGVQFEVHNGRGYVPLVVSEKMVGHRFGEFAWTRKMPQHPLTKRQALPTKAK
jgi:small subunit ribosomal protein S19